jgi:hypothetical protein
MFLACVHLNSPLTSSTYPVMFHCLPLSSILYLAPWDAVDGHIGASIAVLHVQVGVHFRKIRYGPSLYDVAVSWLRLQTLIDCIPHSYWMFTKCLSTLRCCSCRWAYGYTLMPYYMCRWGWILGKMGYGWACMMMRCHGWGCKPPKTASHIHNGCIQSVWAPWDAVDGHMGTHLCL